VASEVTFLFTDIERSTRLLEELGEAYVGVLEEHRRLLTSAVEGEGGRVVDCRGDELFAVFDAAEAALAAAVAGQRALLRAEWPGAAPVRVRMGLHTGRAQSAGDGFVGLAVHHAARVAQAAHGGQIVASEATLDAAAGDGWSTEDLGEFDLRGIPRPTRLFRVGAPDLPADFPPPQATPSGPAPPRVALADDSVLLREGIAAILEENGFDVVGQAGTAEDLLELVDATLPDVAVVDIRMPPTKTDEGIRAAAEIQRRHPRTGVLLLSQHVDVENALHLFAGEAAGVGYLLKDRVADVDDFVAAVHRIHGGGIAIDGSLLEQIRSGLWPAHAQSALEAVAARAAVVGG
jgi:class 3 adenylate cyclase/DNA-binding NarL/FixJ family response regulator